MLRSGYNLTNLLRITLFPILNIISFSGFIVKNQFFLKNLIFLQAAVLSNAI